MADTNDSTQMAARVFNFAVSPTPPSNLVTGATP
jgi:hypothetical protein